MMCQRCGAWVDAFAVAKTLFLVSETDFDRLKPLLRGDLDEARCPSCVAPLGVTATIVAVFPDRDIVAFVLGGLMRDRRDDLLSLDWRSALPGGGPPHLVEVADAEALRRVVVGVLAERLSPINDLARAVVEGADATFLHENWRAFTPNVFAAAHLAATDDITGLRLGPPGARPVEHPHFASLVTPDLYEEDERVAALTLLQGLVIVELCEEWTGRLVSQSDPPDALTFEGDLATYIDGGPDFDQLAAALQVFEESAPEDFAERLSPYVLEAVRASIYAHLDEPNPQALRWAQLFFGHELALRQWEHAPRALAASVISAERAQATVRYDDAWHAVTGWLAQATSGEHREAFPADTAELLHQIATKAGHRSLLQAASQYHARSTIDTVEGVVEELRTQAKSGAAAADALVGLARLHAEFLVVQGRLESLETVAETMLDCLGGGDESRARVEAWLSGAFNRASHPARALARIGDSPRPWEDGISDDAKASLWHERAGALAQAGRSRRVLGDTPGSAEVAARVLRPVPVGTRQPGTDPPGDG
jgi:hypothetical protein